MQVGTKDLKNRLSHYLEIVRAGEPIQVTVRGKVVAEIRAVTAAATDDGACVDELERVGLATRGRGDTRDVSPMTMRGKRTLSEMSNEDRGGAAPFWPADDRLVAAAKAERHTMTSR